MKKVLIIFFVIILFSCNKQIENGNSKSASISNNLLTGIWHIDNSSNVMQRGNLLLLNKRYTGTSDDFFDFKEDGDLTIHEGLIIRQLNYQVKTNKIFFYYKSSLVDSIGVTFNSKASLSLDGHVDLGYGETMDRSWTLSR